jgi:hypothetical protein
MHPGLSVIYDSYRGVVVIGVEVTLHCSTSTHTLAPTGRFNNIKAVSGTNVVVGVIRIATSLLKMTVS